MTIDTDSFRADLEEHRTRLQRTIENHDIGGSSLTEEIGELMSSSADNHLADTASETYERSSTRGSRRTAGATSCGRWRGAGADRVRRVRDLRGLWKEIPVERLEAVPWTSLCIDDARKRQR